MQTRMAVGRCCCGEIGCFICDRGTGVTPQCAQMTSGPWTRITTINPSHPNGIWQVSWNADPTAPEAPTEETAQTAIDFASSVDHYYAYYNRGEARLVLSRYGQTPDLDHTLPIPSYMTDVRSRICLQYTASTVKVNFFTTYRDILFQVQQIEYNQEVSAAIGDWPHVAYWMVEGAYFDDAKLRHNHVDCPNCGEVLTINP